MMNPVTPGITARAFRKLGDKITSEPVKQAIEAVGTAGIAPLAIILSPGPNTRESKNEKKYQALRQIPSIILKYGMAFAVALLVGKRISKVAWKGILPKGMNSKLTIQLDKFKDVDDLVSKLNLKNVSADMKARLTELKELAIKLKDSEGKIKNVYGEIEKFLEPFVSKSTAILKEKSIINRADKLMESSLHLATKEKAYSALKGQYKELKSVAKQAKNQSTRIIQDLRASGNFTQKQLEVFDGFVKEHMKEPFKLYKQIVQFSIALATLPVSAYMLNVVYPPFVKAVAPGLAKEVEEANR